MKPSPMKRGGHGWGWDPKENGALLIVLWNAVILHARWGGLVRERGLMNLAVFGNVVTSFSWFGVNMLGIGLHSYGFMDAAFKWLLMFVVLQVVIIGDGLLPNICWGSREQVTRGFGAAVRWIALGMNVLIMLIGFLAGYNSAPCIVALLADGVQPDQIYPIDIDRAIRKLSTIKSEIVWFDTGSQIQDFLTSGEVSMGMAFNGRAKAAADAGSPVEAVWAQQLVAIDQGCVVKGSKHKAAAMQFLAWITGAEHGGALTAEFPYPPANSKASVDPASKDWLPSSHFDQPYLILDQDYLNNHFTDMDPKFQAFKAS